jgi:hypothetical protein
MICGVCKVEIPSAERKRHLVKYHKLDEHFVNWIIKTDDELISLKRWYIWKFISTFASIKKQKILLLSILYSITLELGKKY